MKFRILNESIYDYDSQVSLSIQRLYLRPRENSRQRLKNYDLKVFPSTTISNVLDALGNDLTLVWFSGLAKSVTIYAEAEVETLDANPFDFVLSDYASKFPFKYDLALDPGLLPYQYDTHQQEAGPLLKWLEEHFSKRPSDTIEFITALNTAVFSQLKYAIREEAGIQTPEQTVKQGGGTCRDYAVLFAALCRNLGLAARFVSGYLYAPPEEENKRSVGTMHAWTEVYLPGAGWKGFDPTHGVWCGERFVPVAHGLRGDAVNPVQGSFYDNNQVGSRMKSTVTIDLLA